LPIRKGQTWGRKRRTGEKTTEKRQTILQETLAMKEREVKKCYFCGVEMQFAEKVPFRIKGTP